MATASRSAQAFEYVWRREGRKSGESDDPLGTISCSVACVKDPAPGEAPSTKVKVLDIHKAEVTKSPSQYFGKNHVNHSWPVHTGFITSRIGHCPRVCLSYAEHKEAGAPDVEAEPSWHYGYEHDLLIRVYLDGNSVPEVTIRIPHGSAGNKDTIDLYRIDPETGLHRPLNWQDRSPTADPAAGQRRAADRPKSLPTLIKDADSTSSIRVAISMEHSWKGYRTISPMVHSPQIVQGPSDETLNSAIGRRCTHNLVEAYPRAVPPASDDEDGPIAPSKEVAELPLVEFIFYYKSKKKLEELGIRQKEPKGNADNKRPAAAALLPSQPRAKRMSTGMTERQQMAALQREQELDRATSAPLSHHQSTTDTPLPHLQPAKFDPVPHFQPASSAPPSSLQSQPSHVKASRPPLRPSSSTLPSFKRKSAILPSIRTEQDAPQASTSTASVESIIQRHLEKSTSTARQPPCADAMSIEQAKNEGMAAENAALDDVSSGGMQVDSILDISVQSGAGSRRTSIFSHTSRSTARTSPFPKQESPGPECLQDKTEPAGHPADKSAAMAGNHVNTIEISDDDEDSDEDESPLLARCGLLAKGLPPSPKVKSEHNDTRVEIAVAVKMENQEDAQALGNEGIPALGEAAAQIAQASLDTSSQLVAEAADDAATARLYAGQVVARIFAGDQISPNAIGVLRKLGLVATVGDFINKQKSVSPAWQCWLAREALTRLKRTGWDLTSAVQVLSMLKMSTPQASLDTSSQLVAEAADDAAIARLYAGQVVARIFAGDQISPNAIGVLRKLGLVATVGDFINKQKSVSPVWQAYFAGEAFTELERTGWDLTSAVQVLSMLKMRTPERD